MQLQGTAAIAELHCTALHCIDLNACYPSSLAQLRFKGVSRKARKR